MSLNFENENVFYVPEDGKLTVYDIYNWQKFEWDIHKAKIILQSDYINAVKENISSTYKLMIKKEKDKAGLKKFSEKMISFFTLIETAEPNAKVAYDFKDLFTPISIFFWTRLSDTPLESFSDEDYPELVNNPAGKNELIDLIVPIPGAFCFHKIKEHEISLPWEEGKEAFYMKIPADTFKISNIESNSFLPIIDEYIGCNGSSSFGNIANYNSKGEITPENLACIPMNRKQDSFFSTLYFQFKTEILASASLILTEKESDNVLQSLKMEGFEIINEKSGNYILSDNDRILHFYYNCPAVETEGSRFLPPLIISVPSEANNTIVDRALALQRLRKILKKNSK